MNVLTDKYGRVHDYVRISLIDKCNLNCIYCNPVNRKKSFTKSDNQLSRESIVRLSRIFVTQLGIKKIRFTGGEPLLRKDFSKILNGLKLLKDSFPFKIGITTNGTKLSENTSMLMSNGVDYLNISLDTLQKDRFKEITGKDLFYATIDAIDKSMEYSFEKIKVNAVIMKGINDDELIDFVDYFKDTNVNLRFIEYMPFGNNDWQEKGFISCNEMKEIIGKKFELKKIQHKVKISEDYSIKGHKGIVSFISPISNHFCRTCNRLRITSAGAVKLCLFSKTSEPDLREMLLNVKYSDEDIKDYFTLIMNAKEEKHSEVDELIKLSNNNMLNIGG